MSIGPLSGGQSAWHGFWGVVLGLMTVALLVWTAARVFGVKLPGELPEGLVTLALGALILLFAVIKALSDNFVHWPAYIGIVLAAGVAYGAWLVFKDSGESLPRMATATPGTTNATTAPPPAAPAAEEDAGS